MSRSPRYALSPTENRFMRYAHKDDKGHTFTTRFTDVSHTGLAFITDRDISPQVSDLIKIEFSIAEGSTIAWWARVVRVEECSNQKWYLNEKDFHDENQVLVAVAFHELPSGHARRIQEELNKKFQELHTQQRKARFRNMGMHFVSHFWQLLFYALCIGATIWILKVLAQPDLVYLEGKGTPWGERFPIFQWKDNTGD